jgi:hypothetical protein
VSRYGYDDSLKVGDVITAYHSGYHVLTRIEKRNGHNPLAHYITILDGKCNKHRKPIVRQNCDMHYCKRVPRTIIENQHPTVAANLEWIFWWADEYKAFAS